MRIGVVNDMALAVESIRRVLLHSPGHELAWIARDGVQAVERCVSDPPDMVLMDLIMPGMDGVEATRQIMKYNPCPIVIVTASVDGNASKVFEAMGAGAVDAVNTPVWEQIDNRGGEALLGKIRTIQHLVVGHSETAVPVKTVRVVAAAHALPLIALGASAGGPAALARILSQLSPDTMAAIVIAQHVDARFTPGLVEWLSHQTRLKVKIADEGEIPTAGTILLACGSKNLAFVDTNRLGYVSSPQEPSYCPSIDILFNSITKYWQGPVTGVLLTGMGRDGAIGLKALRDAGHPTLVQDQATSAVYGMPKAAVELDAASEILPVDEIAAALRKHLTAPIQIS